MFQILTDKNKNKKEKVRYVSKYVEIFFNYIYKVENYINYFYFLFICDS